jgi:hypothetical protein
MPNEIDYVMDLDPESLADKDIDAIIAYERKMMAYYEAGGKPKKEGAMSGGELLAKLALVKPPEPIKRRY